MEKKSKNKSKKKDEEEKKDDKPEKLKNAKTVKARHILCEKQGKA